ncbi:hypothetical protein FE257_009157 [Aspergillus nanangensis]|uniref:Uncharacterized protein n=1 Tax=Aspergillus nanangensis TaxID=2582783 RepID=A0AAD4GSZ4_ASPNN|nr:hypothetical protein FE257_009157 [Aspergillus nanangensis]
MNGHPRTVYLLSCRPRPSQRAHFAIFVPSAPDPTKGTAIHVVGAPMAGFVLEFKRNYVPDEETEPHELVPVGQVHARDIVDSSSPGGAMVRDNTPRGNIEIAASQIPPPRISENFMAPVNDEWTMEFVRHLVTKGIIGEEAIGRVQAKRDSATHGIGLRAVG